MKGNKKAVYDIWQSEEQHLAQLEQADQDEEFKGSYKGKR